MTSDDAANGPSVVLPADASPDVRDRVHRLWQRALARPDLPAEPQPAGVAEQLGRHTRQNLARWMAASTEVDGIDDMAASAARSAPLGGAPLSDAAQPLIEATWAEAYLKERRDSPLSPYLFAFLMTRYRYAFELQGLAGNAAAQAASAKKYRAFLQRARGATDPLFQWLADDIDRQPYLVLATPTHPRDFNPDT